jgi:hypothetical protein
METRGAMSNNVVSLRPGEQDIGRGFGDGGGPEDPMLEQRVGKLEEKVDRIEAILTRLEPKIMEILHTGAKQSADIVELKTSGAKQVDLTKLQADAAEIKNKLPVIDGRFTGLDGRLSGLSDRIGSLPSVWTMLGIVFTTWALGSGILIFAMNYLRK